MPVYYPGANTWVTTTNSTTAPIHWGPSNATTATTATASAYYYQEQQGQYFGLSATNAARLYIQQHAATYYAAMLERAELQPPPRPNEQLLAQAAETMHEQRRLVQEARTRAHELLLEHLTPAQRKTFVENKWFMVEGDSKTRYRIKDTGSIVANIDVLNATGAVTHRLCGHARHGIPHSDQLLVQKVMIECDEAAFLRIANRHPAP